LNVLVIDDDPDVRSCLAAMLKHAGHNVTTAVDGRDGIARFQRRNTDIVITDVRMPGLDGVEVLARVKEIDPEAEVIMITGFDDSDAVMRSLQHGASDFLQKPFRSDVLLEALVKPIERRDLRLQNRMLEESIVRAQALNAHIADSVPSALLVLSGDLRVDWTNQRVEEMFGRLAAEGQSVFVSDVLGCSGEAGGECPLIAELNSFVDSGQPVRDLELSLNTNAGARDFRVSIDLLQGEEKILLVVDDITSHRQLEQALQFKEWQLIHADKLASLGKMIAGLAHEIHDPLTCVRGNVQNIKRVWSSLGPMVEAAVASLPDETIGTLSLLDIVDEMPRLLDDAESNTDRLVGIVNHLRRFSRADKEGQRIPVSLSEVVDSALGLLGNRIDGQVVVTRREEGSIPVVGGDPQKLEQVFVNVIGNALEAVGEVAEPEIVIRIAADQDGLVTAEVIDNGCGMSADVLDHIFEPFFTTRPPGAGTGLGLAVAKGIVEEHDGRLSAISSPAHGTTVTVAIPVETDVAAGETP